MRTEKSSSNSNRSPSGGAHTESAARIGATAAGRRQCRLPPADRASALSLGAREQESSSVLHVATLQQSLTAGLEPRLRQSLRGCQRGRLTHAIRGQRVQQLSLAVSTQAKGRLERLRLGQPVYDSVRAQGRDDAGVAQRQRANRQLSGHVHGPESPVPRQLRQQLGGRQLRRFLRSLPGALGRHGDLRWQTVRLQLPVPSGAPHGTRTKCTANDPTCGGSCKGKSDGTCDYPKGDCGDASCVQGSQNKFLDHGKCSTGSCVPAEASECRYHAVCKQNACVDLCTVKTDCMSGYACNKDNGHCQPEVIKITISSDTARSGSVSTAGIPNSKLLVGDDTSNANLYAFVYFDTSTIPKGSVIQTAELVIYQALLARQPYTVLGNMKVEHVAYTNLTNAHQLESDKNEDRTISVDTNKGDKDANVSSMLMDDFEAGKRNSQFLFRFENNSNGDGAADYAQIDPTGDTRPRLIIEYHAAQ